jgi:1,4-dihydroxy-6-naphthoate synthase
MEDSRPGGSSGPRGPGGPSGPSGSLTLAYSPCPNDTFIFTPWAEGRIDGAPPVIERYEDIDTLNRIALAGEPDVVKISFHAFGHLRERYGLLRSGGALGRGCGPLVVARSALEAWELGLAGRTVAIPGQLTTAALLLRLFAPDLSGANIVVLPFYEIMPAVCSGRVDAGVIIHESRFTYQRHGLVRIVDLGEWWERETGQAIPLGGIAMRRDLGDDLIRRTERTLTASVDYAHAHPEHVWPTIRRHAQEMEDEIMRQHIALYVNDFTRDYGTEGEAAIRYLLDRAETLEIVPRSNQPLFATGST